MRTQTLPKLSDLTTDRGDAGLSPILSGHNSGDNKLAKCAKDPTTGAVSVATGVWFKTRTSKKRELNGNYFKKKSDW